MTYPHPSLYLVLHDPSIDLQAALNSSLAQPIDIDALGTSSINLGVVQRKAWRKQPAFSYFPTVTSIPAADISCDLANNSINYVEPCTAFLEIRIPGTEVTIKEDVPSLTFSVSEIWRCVLICYLLTADEGPCGIVWSIYLSHPIGYMDPFRRCVVGR